MGVTCSSNQDIHWGLKEMVPKFNRYYFKLAKRLASKLFLSQRYYDAFVSNSPGNMCVRTHEEFNQMIHSVKFQLVAAENNDNMDNTIYIQDRLLFILAKAYIYEKIAKCELLQCAFLVTAILINEVSQVLYIRNTTQANQVCSYDSVLSAREFGQRMEIELFGAPLAVQIVPRNFQSQSTNLMLTKQNCLSVIVSNVNESFVKNILENPEDKFELQFTEVDKYFDTRACTSAKRESYIWERYEDRLEDLIA